MPKNIFYRAYHLAALIPPLLYWRRRRIRLLTDDEKNHIASLLATGYYVILTGTRGHWSSWLVQVATFIRLGKLTHYSHSLMNCDFMSDAADKDKFKFLEATSIGAHYSTFDEVFEDADHVCLLTPSSMENESWTEVIDALIKERGLPYDDLYDLSDKTAVSCVELVLDAFKVLPDYAEHFGHLDSMIQQNGNILLPVMYKECPDFRIEYETGEEKKHGVDKRL